MNSLKKILIAAALGTTLAGCTGTSKSVDELFVDDGRYSCRATAHGRRIVFDKKDVMKVYSLSGSYFMTRDLNQKGKKISIYPIVESNAYMFKIDDPNGPDYLCMSIDGQSQ